MSYAWPGTLVDPWLLSGDIDREQQYPNKVKFHNRRSWGWQIFKRNSVKLYRKWNFPVSTTYWLTAINGSVKCAVLLELKVEFKRIKIPIKWIGRSLFIKNLRNLVAMSLLELLYVSAVLRLNFSVIRYDSWMKLSYAFHSAFIFEMQIMYQFALT